MARTRYPELINRRSYQTLWQSLQEKRDKDDPTRRVLHDMLSLVDIMSPFDLIDRLLARHDGRQRLKGRLGPECEEAIDAFLALALDYENAEPASLIGFLGWLERDNVRVKRQTDGAGDLIRVMTTHGAKGLESPIVILPDTGTSRRNSRNDAILVDGDGPIWKPEAGEMDPRSQAALDAQKALEEEEKLRLFYVAMTRAESWLILCGAGTAKDSAWYSMADAAMSALTTETIEHADGARTRFTIGQWPSPSSDGAKGALVQIPLPDWAVQRAPTPSRKEKIVSPSTLEGSKALPGETLLDASFAMERGTKLHTLLEHLPNFPQEVWVEKARELNGNSDETGEILAEATAVLTSTDLAHLFGANSYGEVPISANLPELGGKRISGFIDRLVVSGGRVLVVDFKSSMTVPSTPSEVPVGILRQLGAYCSAVAQIFPDHEIDAAVLWTRNAALMNIKHDIVRSALASTRAID